jgi:hypothetical protein
VARLTPAAQARFGHVGPTDLARARVLVVPVLTPGVAAMTLGRFVFVRRGHERDVGLVAHELVHVEQWRELGVVQFLRVYLRDYLRGRRAGMTHWAAYRAISLEADARSRAGH